MDQGVCYDKDQLHEHVHVTLPCSVCWLLPSKNQTSRQVQSSKKLMGEMPVKVAGESGEGLSDYSADLSPPKGWEREEGRIWALRKVNSVH